jgi:hypothetical protein
MRLLRGHMLTLWVRYGAYVVRRIVVPYTSAVVKRGSGV